MYISNNFEKTIEHGEKMNRIQEQPIQVCNRNLNAKIVSTKSNELLATLKDENILGIVEFYDGKTPAADKIPKHIPYLRVHMYPYLGHSFAEVWTSTDRIYYGLAGSFRFATDSEHMFTCISCPENNQSLCQLSKKVYDDLFHNINRLNYQHIFRIWNFIPNINGEDGDRVERYKSFSCGRSVSFRNNVQVDENFRFSAATGIGSISGNVSIYCLSALIPKHIHFENPRQTPAYKYPQQYGPKSPSFARATYYNRGNNCFDIYIAGTASVVGHESVHIGDIKKQCETTVENIKALLSKENLKKNGIKREVILDDLDCIKVYIRHKDDFPIIKKLCEQIFSPKSPILYMQADICRSDLLVEIEGIIQK